MLEDNQVLVQGMMANRYMDTFREAITGWNKKLMAVADVVQLLTEIQRTWAYLESLFIGSEEVKREVRRRLPRAAGTRVQPLVCAAAGWPAPG
jgi:dynein heavy chain